MAICRQLVECGHQNHWYVRQCVHCDAGRWDIELRARVSAILQVSLTLQTFKQCQMLYVMHAVRLLGLLRKAI